MINPPKILRSTKVGDNLRSNFDISDISKVVHNLNPSFESTLFNYKEFALPLNINEFLKDANFKCCCNKYNNSFINNHYGHSVTGNRNIDAFTRTIFQKWTSHVMSSVHEKFQALKTEITVRSLHFIFGEHKFFFRE